MQRAPCWHKKSGRYRNLSTNLLNYQQDVFWKYSTKIVYFFFRFSQVFYIIFLARLWSPTIRSFVTNFDTIKLTFLEFLLSRLFYFSNSFFLFFNFVGSSSIIFALVIVELPCDIFLAVLLYSLILKHTMRFSTVIFLHFCFK